MRSSRPKLRIPLIVMTFAGVSALLVAGCGWSPGGPAIETPTAIAPLVLQPPATRSAELLTLVAMMPAATAETLAETPDDAPGEVSTPLPPASASATPVLEVTTPAPEETAATSAPTPSDTPAVETAVAATIAATTTATIEERVVPTEAPTATLATQEATEVTPEVTPEAIPEAIPEATLTEQFVEEATPEETASATDEVAPTSSSEAIAEIGATPAIEQEEVIETRDATDVVGALRATTITLPLAGAVTAFPLVDGRHAIDGAGAELATDARVRLLSPVVEGDLNSDGIAEVVALAEIGVGDRSLVYLLAFANEESGSSGASLTQVARVLVGADVRVSPPIIEDQVVRLEVDQWQGESPLCCAVRRQQFGYALEEDMLAMVESDDLAMGNGVVAINELALMPQAVATAQARESDLQRSVSVAGEAEVDAINLYTVTVAARDTLHVATAIDALPVRLIVASVDEPVTWRDGSAAFPLAITLPATQTVWIGVQGVEMATPYTLTVTLAPPQTSR